MKLVKVAFFALAFLLVLSVSVYADPVLLDPGDAAGWDTGLTYLGTFPGNDSISSVKSALGLGPLDDLYMLGTSEAPDGFTYTGLGGTSGTWAYSGGAIVRYLVIKAGDQFALYEYDPTRSSGNWSTENLSVGSGNVPQISHVSFYATSTAVPEPTSLLLLGVGLLGISILCGKRS